MITDWFRALQRSLLIWGGNSNLYGTFYYKNIQGNDRYMSGYTFTPSAWTYATSATSAGIHLGSGTTTPTATDEALENDLFDSISVQVTSTVREKVAGGWSQTVYMTVTNTSDESITVAEIGYYGSVRGGTTEGGTSSTNSNMVTMFDRTLLPTPVTIPAGDAATISYRVTVS